MVQIFLIGLIAGLVAALMCASIVTKTLISIFLFYLAPLPILIAALGWSHWAGLLAAVIASLALAEEFGIYLFASFLLSIGLPAWWFGYLALLARPVTNATAGVLEWYPIGRLVVWIAIVSALIVVAGMLSVATSEDMLREKARESVEEYLNRSDPSLDPQVLQQAGRRFEALLPVALPGVAVFMTMINLALVWLAGRIVKMSNRLRRPWPDLAGMAFPALTSALLAAACAGILLTGLPGITSSVFAASLATIYGVLGFAVLHVITRGLTNRGLLLASAYVAVAMLWPFLLLVALLGLADATFDIRGRFAHRTGPPTIPT